MKNKKFYSEKNIKKLIYFKKKDLVMDLLLFSLCTKDKKQILHIQKLIDYVNDCKIPKFPISGDYLKKHGYESGKTLGKKLKSLEEEWIENNFIMDKKIFEKSLDKVNSN